MKDDFIDFLLMIIISTLLVFSLMAFLSYVISEESKYQYECVTIDNETITCDKVNTTEGGIIGTRDDTSYLIKQYKKIKKEVK